MCHQSVGLIQGRLEADGFVTISTTVRPEITRHSLVARAVYVRFPIGNPFGEAGRADQQRTILRFVLGQIETIEEPGRVVEAPYRWRRM